MSFLGKIKAIQNLSEQEIKNSTPIHASWHMKVRHIFINIINQYKHSAYINISGLNTEISEGDIVRVFSQFGEIVDIRLLRDKENGKSKGVAFLAYEDQRSTILAVDNLNGITVSTIVII